MSVQSLNSRFSLGTQGSKGTAATAFITALSTVSGGDVEFDERAPENEHPGPSGGLAIDQTAVTERTGFLVPVTNTFILRPKYIGRVLRTMGFGVSTVDNTGYYTHTFTFAAAASASYGTAIHLLDGSSSDLERKVIDIRGRQLQITGDTSVLRGVFDGVGLNEGAASGSETKVSEIDVPISIYSGSITADIGGDGIASLAIRGSQLTIQQTLDEEDKVHFSTTRNDNAVLSRSVSGSLQNIDIDMDTYLLYKGTKWGGSAGTAPSTDMPTGTVTWTYQSLSNISGEAVPYSLTVLMPTVEWRMTTPQANGRDLVRGNLDFRMPGITGETPITITLVNDVASYA